MEKYCSFLIFRPNHASVVERLSSRAGWDVQFITDPSRRFKFSRNGLVEIARADAVETLGRLHEDETYGQLLVVTAGESDANNIIELVWSAHIILSGFPDQKKSFPGAFPIPLDKSKRESLFENVFRTAGYFDHFKFDEQLPVAVAMAARAWGDRHLIYAIHKLARSYETETITPWSTHPRYEQAFEKHSDKYADHVTTSIAVNLAYSAIEELGLEIRSSKKQPRWLDNRNFNWNPKVLEDIEKRLIESCIDPKESIDWVLRGAATEHKVEPFRHTLSYHSDGKNVRDVEYSIPDAIHACSYLRNFLTAHSFREGKTDLIGPYEVYNVQQTARLLIIRKCRLWDTWTDDLIKSQ